MKKISLFIKCFLVITGVFILTSFISRKEDPLDKLIAALQKWSDTNPQEKVYLHMDKPYYAVGDTIWFKGYVTTGSRHQLSAISGALYVDLINERDSIIRSLKLPVTAGMAIGDITLGDELEAGNYRMRAYTQWMRNAGEDYFFDKTFTVGSVFSNNIVTRAGYMYQDIKGKQVLTATLNFTDDKGQPLANKNVLYRIIVDKNTVLTKSAKTDTQGNIMVNIANENKTDLTGAYIQTTLKDDKNKEVVKNFPIKANLSQSDVQFFPESGYLVNGITSRVAFKAVGVDGLGVNITGKIIDNDNKEIADMATTHTGMGSFQIRPDVNKTYTAKINFADGTTKTLPLPKANNEGYVLSVYQPNKDSILVRINTKQPAQPQSLNLIAQTGGETIFASNIKIEKAITSVWLEKKAFPTGIAQFTIFDNNGEPLNERIAFIRSNDQLQLSVKTNKTSYNSREKVTVELEAKDNEGKPTTGNFSVSVIDKSKVPSDEMNETSIFSSLLLSSDIKGYIEKPNYYFINVNEKVDKDLDNLMLTQGYHRFIWKEINNINTPQFPKEGYGINISGQVQTLGNKPMPNTTVTLLSLRAKITQFATTDAEGRFKFEGIVVKDSIKFTVQARSAKNSDKLKLLIDSLPTTKVNSNPNIADISIDIPALLKTYIDAGKKQDETYEKMGRMDQVHRLRQVNIRAAKSREPDKLLMQGNLKIPPGAADQTIVLKDPQSCPNLIQCILRQLPAGTRPEVIYGVTTIVDIRGTPLIFYLNGRKVEGDELAEILDGAVEPTDVAKIEIVRSNLALMRSLSGDGSGAILITTRSANYRTLYEPSIANLKLKGFNKVRCFYHPKYDGPNESIKLPDLRTTIFWNPFLKSNIKGAISLSFYTADAIGQYKLAIEGINANGEIGRSVLRFDVR